MTNPATRWACPSAGSTDASGRFATRTTSRPGHPAFNFFWGNDFDQRDWLRSARFASFGASLASLGEVARSSAISLIVTIGPIGTIGFVRCDVIGLVRNMVMGYVRSI
jgi:hypothetical protein